MQTGIGLVRERISPAVELDQEKHRGQSGPATFPAGLWLRADQRLAADAHDITADTGSCRVGKERDGFRHINRLTTL